MATVKMMWRKMPTQLEKYLTKPRGEEMIVRAVDSVDSGMAETIKAEHARFNSKAKNFALELIQSWSPEESRMLTQEKFNEMGQELAQRFAPGHKAWVYTHIETGKTHNHVVICTMNSESGKLLQNQRAEMFKMHDFNNQIAKENGLQVNDLKTNSARSFVPYKAQDMQAHGKQTWLFDGINKMDFARVTATNFDEYRGILKFHGIHTKIENKNISYEYGEDRKPIRGRRLNQRFNKDGLMKAFKENDERNAKHAGIERQFLAGSATGSSREGRALGVEGDLLSKSTGNPGLGEKDYSKFTKIHRRNTHSDLPAAYHAAGGILYSELKRASEKSIFEYLDANKIRTMTNEKGERALSGKEHITFTDKSWKNAQNGRSGTIIDIVKAHRGTDILGAVAILNENTRVQLLAPFIGEYRKGNQSFYFPKPKAALPEVAEKVMRSFLQFRGYSENHAKSVLRHSGAHVGIDGSVWLTGEKNNHASEFNMNTRGEWSEKRHGKQDGSFFEAITKSHLLVVHRDPVEFLTRSGKLNTLFNQGASHLVLTSEHAERKISEVLALNPHIREVQIAPSSNPKERAQEKQFAQKMKSMFDPFDILVKELTINEMGRTPNRGPDIGR